MRSNLGVVFRVVSKTPDIENRCWTSEKEDICQHLT
nr:MAG TPA: hypothetical protein [Caudoviricetes sp.]